ncbi:MAG: hypothetical protein KIIPBIDF_01772 [Candidatus Methanoperedenaceae archaeon GB50]|nr:MAG: hypothetical protein KIIPBIDF_01772 [Candidatus Methanoperedenaceae archaeon GB50]
MKEPKDIETFVSEQKQMLEENPECASAQYNLGIALLQEGKLDEARIAFEQSIVDGSRMFEAFVNLGYIYFKKET